MQSKALAENSNVGYRDDLLVMSSIQQDLKAKVLPYYMEFKIIHYTCVHAAQGAKTKTCHRHESTVWRMQSKHHLVLYAIIHLPANLLDLVKCLIECLNRGNLNLNTSLLLYNLCNVGVYNNSYFKGIGLFGGSFGTLTHW